MFSAYCNANLGVITLCQQYYFLLVMNICRWVVHGLESVAKDLGGELDPRLDLGSIFKDFSPRRNP